MHLCVLCGEPSARVYWWRMGRRELDPVCHPCAARPPRTVAELVLVADNARAWRTAQLVEAAAASTESQPARAGGGS